MHLHAMAQNPNHPNHQGNDIHNAPPCKVLLFSAEFTTTTRSFLHFHNGKRNARRKMPHIHTHMTHAYAPINANALCRPTDTSKEEDKKQQQQKTEDGRRRNTQSKMFLPEPKPHLPTRRLLGRPLDIPSSRIRPAEIHPDVRLQTALQPADIRPVHDTIPHGAEEATEIRAAEIRARAEFGQGILGGADAVEVDVGGGVEIHFLREVGVNAEEFGPRARMRGGGLGLVFQAAEQSLEPFEGGGVLADPDEFDAAEAAGRVGPRAQVPDVLEDAGPGGDADAGADEDGDFVVEDVFGGGAVGSVDADVRHGLVVLQRDLVDARWVEAVEFLGLRGAAPEGVADVARPVADLAHVNADVGVEGAGGDGEGVPLGGADRGDVDEQPLPGFVPHRRFLELDLHGVVRVTDDFGDLGGPA